MPTLYPAEEMKAWPAPKEYDGQKQESFL